MDSGKKAATSGNIILILIAMVLGVIIGLMFDSHQPATTMDEHRSLQGKIGEVIGLVERQYVDSMDADSLSERLVSVMLSDELYDDADALKEAIEAAREDPVGAMAWMEHPPIEVLFWKKDAQE